MLGINDIAFRDNASRWVVSCRPCISRSHKLIDSEGSEGEYLAAAGHGKPPGWNKREGYDWTPLSVCRGSWRKVVSEFCCTRPRTSITSLGESLDADIPSRPVRKANLFL